MSLEELLAREGFKRSKSRMMHRASFGGEARVMPLSSFNGDQRRPASLGLKKTERTKSDLPRYHQVRGEFPSSDKVKGIMLQNERRQSNSFSSDSHESLVSRETVSAAPSNEIVEVKMQEPRVYQGLHSNELYSPEEETEAKYDRRNQKRENYRQSSDKYTRTDKPPRRPSSKSGPLQKYYNETEQDPSSSRTSNKSKFKKKADIASSFDTPALDEAAIQAMISILSGYAKRFIKDENFRASHRENSFASLHVVGDEECTSRNEGKVLESLEEAIETVERATEERASVKDLKKASLQLSVITGLNSNDLKDGYTCGIPNFKLSACAHFYLSVIYKLQKKDRVAAKHLLQVFCDSPFQARTELLPDLWEQIFFPHLSDLIFWYKKESDSVAHSPGQIRKLKLVEKVYNEIMDSGTYQFAAYYKDWLTEGVEAPVLPSIQIPSVPVQLLEEADLDDQSPHPESPINSSLQVPMVSKTLYEAVFRHTVKPETELADCEEESFDVSMRSLHDTAVGESSSSEMYKGAVPDTDVRAPSLLNATSRLMRVQRSHIKSSPESLDVTEKFGMPEVTEETSGDVPMCNALPAPNSSEVILSTLASEVFKFQPPEVPTIGAPALLLSTQDALNSDGLPEASWSPVAGGSSCMSIPRDFICPLTDVIFDDPVTIETGQTYESSAIKSWLEKGNRTCPVTGKTLEYRGVPLTNFILKRVIDDWKVGHAKHLMDLASKVSENVESKDEMAVFILEQLITASSPEERIRRAKQLTSLGGLKFLLHRFHCGSPGEKTHISELLLICIQADTHNRNHITRNIDKLSLLDLLHSKQLKIKRIAVLLLTELVCLNRRKEAKYFLDGLQKEEISGAMHVLLTYLQSCPPEQRPTLAVLLLHLDLLVEPENHCVYRVEAVDAITMALEHSSSDEKVCEKCCRSLLVLGGYFSFAGKIMTEDWILKQAGFLDGPVFVSPDNQHKAIVDDSIMMMEDVEETVAREKWLVKLSASLLGDGNRSFLEAMARCLFSEKSHLVRVCLTTVAWLSSALVSLSEAEYQLGAFSALISGLKDCLQNGELVELKILASMCLLNFSKFPECRLLLMTMADEIASTLENLSGMTWTAKELYSTICT
ncbi:OLC1v1005878C1 [Oldenlandia corymbosa var. corymbosa]|uniref:RING-type E3 ubiquitin transferase n=1 Tax=Oldenlandia corymbosa var. corymbosa TaxID=529605 RepID=A0AAV1DFT0_OLDCO|nr:OLC1v1005878C1 [Oldenlandia corymbosa var. corymbosa]